MIQGPGGEHYSSGNLEISERIRSKPIKNILDEYN
jgi:hypothetical protein